MVELSDLLIFSCGILVGSVLPWLRRRVWVMREVKARRLDDIVARKLFEEMSEFGTQDEPSHEAHSEENE